MREKIFIIRPVIEIELHEEDIENIVVTALEGGIDYWASLETEPWFAEGQGPVSVQAVRQLLSGQSIRFCDAEDMTTGDDWVLTLDKLLAGIKQGLESEARNLSDIEFDAANADCIIQYALFGKLVFG